MKTFIAVMLVSSVALADPPDSHFATASADAPIADQESPVLAPPIPGVSVRLRAGETAPFDGRLVELGENLKRGQKLADCRGELEDAKTNVWSSKGVLVGIIIGSIALGAAAGAGVTAWAMSKK
jgi:hypothetical protein